MDTNMNDLGFVAAGRNMTKILEMHLKLVGTVEIMKENLI